MRIPLLALGALLALAGAASAETTVIRRDAPDVVVERPASESKTVTVRDHGDGCVSKTVRKENADGDTKTVHKETCD